MTKSFIGKTRPKTEKELQETESKNVTTNLLLKLSILTLGVMSGQFMVLIVFRWSTMSLTCKVVTLILYMLVFGPSMWQVLRNTEL